MARSIVHLDMDTFFVSCEILENSHLKGFPLIVGGGERGVVASCSYEARQFGVRAAMPIRMALQLCPEARIIRGDMEKYAKLSDDVTEIIKEWAPVVEKASIDEHYLDLTGMDRFFGCYKFTTELSQYITKQTGLPLSFALSVNKTVSKIGTGQAKPVGRMEISEDQVRNFLNPLPVRKIPMVGDVTANQLSRMEIRTIKTLAEMPPEGMQALLGKNGLTLWKKANGIDLSPVEPYSEKKSISTEMTFNQDTISMAFMNSVLIGMVEKLGFQLRSEEWLTSVVSVKIRYANFDTETKQSKIPYTSCDNTLNKTIKELFGKLFQRRIRVRMIGIRFSGLVRGTYQINLFEDTVEMMALCQAMDKIKKRFGFKAVMRCGGTMTEN